MFPSKTNEFETVCLWLERTTACDLTPLRSSMGCGVIRIGPWVQALASGSKSTPPMKMHLEDYRILGLVSDT